VQDELRRAVDAIPGLLWTALPDGHVDYLNRRWCEYTGLSLEQARGWGWEVAIHPDDRPAVVSFWRTILGTGRAGEIEGRLRRFDGTFRWFEFRAYPVRDEAGALVMWYGQTTEIDELKRAGALLAGEKKLLEMVAMGAELGDVLEALCRLVEENDARCLCSILLVDPSGAKLVHGAAPALPASYVALLEGRPLLPEWGPCAIAVAEKTQVVIPDLAADVRWHDTEWLAAVTSFGVESAWTTPIVARNGRVLGTFAIYQRVAGAPSEMQRDLTARFTHIASIAIERAQHEAALERSEAFLAKAQHLSSTGSFSWCVSNDAIRWSEQTYRIYEIDPAITPTFEVVATRIHPDDQPMFAEIVERGRRGELELDFEHRLRMPDATVKHLHVVAHASQTDAGELEYVGAVRDVTERRRADDALEQVRSELAHVSRVTTLGELTASIAHEVNQPLAGIVTNASTCLRMLAGDSPNLDGARETARRAIRDANRASDVVARLRVMFGKKSAASEPVDLSEATRDVLLLMRSELEKSRVVLRAELDDALPPVRGDRVQLQQVVLNLVLNAAEAMSVVGDGPRELFVRTALDGDDVRIAVRDSGPGLDPDTRGRIFDAFVTTKSGGMGMGLSVSRSIVDRHHGRIWAEPNEGPGSTFYVSVPRARSTSAPEVSSGP
jgi:PAS domain S-box-containing protein